MKILAWNYFGLKNPQAILALHLLLRYKHLSIVYLIETKLSSRELLIFKWKIGITNAIGVDYEIKKESLA